MADMTVGYPNFFQPPVVATTGNSNDYLQGMVPLLLGATLFGPRGGFLGNNGYGEGAITGAATLAAVNQAGHDTAATILASQNQAQAIQDINRLGGDIREAQAAIQTTVLSGNAQNQNTVLQGQIALMQGQNGITNAVTNGNAAIEADLSRMQNALDNQFATVNAAVATTGTAAALAAKDAQIAGLQNTQFLASTITNDGEKTRALITASFAELPNAREINLERQLGVAEAALMREQLQGATRQGNVDVITNVNQTATQNNLQAQIQALVGAVNTLAHNQTAMAGNLNILGTQNGVVQTPVNVAR